MAGKKGGIATLIVAIVLLVAAGFFLAQRGQMAGKNINTAEEHSNSAVIVIDPGHGGFDGGATASDGTAEKDINLQIAMQLKEVMEDYPVKVVMTRVEDTALNTSKGNIRSMKRQDLQQRRRIIDEIQPDLAVSIHLNNYKADASVYGAQVFYPKGEQKRTEGKNSEQVSESYAEAVQKSIEINISDGRERAPMEKNDILIFENPTCPMILVECGFLSNQNELNKLKMAEYQRKLAYAIWEGIDEILCLEKGEKMKKIDSANR